MTVGNLQRRNSLNNTFQSLLIEQEVTALKHHKSVEDVSTFEDGLKNRCQSDQDLSLEPIDSFYQNKVSIGGYLPRLSTREVQEIDPECENVSRILIIYTGGTIGMKKKEEGYEPEQKFLAAKLAEMPFFNDREFKAKYKAKLNNDHQQFMDCGDFDECVFTLPLSPEKVRVIYVIWEYYPLLDSSDMTMDDYVRITHDIGVHYDDYDGFVVLHGTDTMAYTGSALSFLLEGVGKPVLLTGSQIPLYELRSDGRDNFLNSLIIASHFRFGEVVLVFHDRMMRANRATKVATSDLDAFNSPNLAPLAEIGIDLKLSSALFPENLERPIFHTEMCADVAVLRMSPSISSRLVASFLEAPTRGVVLMSFGSGNMPICRQDLLQLFREAVYERGCLIINISQCPRGSVKAVYKTGFLLASYGIIPGGDMTVEAALTKLAFVTAHNDWSYDRKRLAMTSDIRGEMTIEKKSDYC